MKKFELIVGLIAIFGILLKFFHIPGSGMLTVLSLSLLSIFYYVFTFTLINGIKLHGIFKRESYKNTNAKRIIGSIGFGFVLSSITLGGLFKLQLWPSGTMQLMIGVFGILLILLLSTIFYTRNKDDFYIKIFKRIAIYGSLGLILYLIPATKLVDIYYRDSPDEYIELYKKLISNPDNVKLQEQFEQMQKEMLMKGIQTENDESNKNN